MGAGSHGISWRVFNCNGVVDRATTSSMDKWNIPFGGVEAKILGFAAACRSRHYKDRNTPKEALCDLAFVEACLESGKRGERLFKYRMILDCYGTFGVVFFGMRRLPAVAKGEHSVCKACFLLFQLSTRTTRADDVPVPLRRRQQQR